jgi:iduronate 2-sulfatase
MEGTSFKPLLQTPELDWKTAVFSQFHRDPRVTPDGKRYMGYSMVTPRYHYVEWRYWDNVSKIAGDLAAIELYDRETDPDENTNIAEFKENGQILERLSRQLQRGWRSAVPEGRPAAIETIHNSGQHKPGNRRAVPLR